MELIFQWNETDNDNSKQIHYIVLKKVIHINWAEKELENGGTVRECTVIVNSKHGGQGRPH